MAKYSQTLKPGTEFYFEVVDSAEDLINLDRYYYVEGGKVREGKGYVHHRRSKNYIAHIVGVDERLRPKRKFIEIIKLDKEAFAPLKDFKCGEVYEFAFIYYTGSYSPQEVFYNFAQFLGRRKGKAYFKALEEKEALKIAREEKKEKLDRRKALKIILALMIKFDIEPELIEKLWREVKKK